MLKIQSFEIAHCTLRYRSFQTDMVWEATACIGDFRYVFWGSRAPMVTYFRALTVSLSPAAVCVAEHCFLPITFRLCDSGEYWMKADCLTLCNTSIRSRRNAAHSLRLASLICLKPLKVFKKQTFSLSCCIVAKFCRQIHEKPSLAWLCTGCFIINDWIS